MKEITTTFKNLRWDTKILLFFILIISFYVIIAEKHRGVISGIISGIISSAIIYFLTVTIKDRINCRKHVSAFKSEYRYIKMRILDNVISASIKYGMKGLPIDKPTEYFMNPYNFRRFFSGGKRGDEGFYAFQNYIQKGSDEFGEIVNYIKLMREKLNNLYLYIELEDEELINMIHNIDTILYEVGNAKPGYDEPKQLVYFLYSIYANWDMFKGWQTKDPIERIVDRIC